LSSSFFVAALARGVCISFYLKEVKEADRRVAMEFEGIGRKMNVAGRGEDVALEG
jgi:hypothetical protein